MVLAVFVMYVILAILYESYLHPITVLSSLQSPWSADLDVVGLQRRGFTLRVIGMFMLMGIVKKNGIMIVDFAQQRVQQGLATDEAIHEASMERFQRRERCHDDGPEPLHARLVNGLVSGQALLHPLLREVHDHDPVLLDNPHQHEHADKRVE